MNPEQKQIVIGALKAGLSTVQMIGHTKDCPALDGAGCACGYYDAVAYFKNQLKQYGSGR